MSGTTTAKTQTKRLGVSRQEVNRAASDSDTYQEASAMSETTGTVTEWHPSWCAREDNCYQGSGTVDRVHLSEAATFRRDVGTYGTREDGEAFTASVRMWLHHDAGQHEDMDDWALTAQVKIQSEEGTDEADINMSPDRMRDLADFLFVAADEIDAWRENSAPEEVAGHE